MCVYTHTHPPLMYIFVYLSLSHTYIYIWGRFDKSWCVAVEMFVSLELFLGRPSISQGSEEPCIMHFFDLVRGFIVSTMNSWPSLCISFSLLQIIFWIASGLCYQWVRINANNMFLFLMSVLPLFYDSQLSSQAILRLFVIGFI